MDGAEDEEPPGKVADDDWALEKYFDMKICQNTVVCVEIMHLPQDRCRSGKSCRGGGGGCGRAGGRAGVSVHGNVLLLLRKT